MKKQTGSTYWFLKNFNIFDGLDDETVGFVDKNVAMCEFRKSEPVYLPADPARYVYFLKKGHVKISRYTNDGDEFIVDIVGAGEVFGELSVFENTNNRNGEVAYALDHTMICSIDIQDFKKILEKYPELNFKVTQQMGLRLRKFEQRIQDMVFKDVRQRIVGFLIDYAEKFGRIQNGLITVKPSLSHQEIGYLTGAARQTVTSHLNELRSEGLIDFNRKVFTIFDIESLKKLCC